jgi:hypothetical protein
MDRTTRANFHGVTDHSIRLDHRIVSDPSTLTDKGARPYPHSIAERDVLLNPGARIYCDAGPQLGFA